MKKQLINMKKTVVLCMLLVIGFAVAPLNSTSQVKAANGLPVYRVYNPNSGEHLHTLNYNENVYLTKLGWKAEGISMYATESGNPLYRMYNPNSGEHFYTLNWNEKLSLVSSGWSYEGVAWDTPTTGTPMYRVYNPNARNAGSHHYTASVGERDYLVSIGWKNENIAWYSANQTTGGSDGGATKPPTEPWLQGTEYRTETETYTEQVPYQETETYVVQEETFSTVQFTDNEYYINLKTGGTMSLGRQLAPKYNWDQMLDMADDLSSDSQVHTRKIVYATKQVSNGMHDVTKTREVTKYRAETKTRNVQKAVTYWYKASNPSDKRYQVNKPA